MSENICVEQTHDGLGQHVGQNSSSAHIVKEQFVPEENRDIPSFNTDNEFSRAINEENIDFNIPGVPHSAVKRSHGVNVRNLIQKIENHPHRRALQSDLQQHRQFNLFSKESRDVIEAAGNIELRELIDVEPKAQCKVCLSYWDVGRHRLLHMRAFFCEMEWKRTRNSSSTLLTFFSIPNYYIKKGRPHGHRFGKKEGDHEYFIANSFKKKCKKRKFLSIHDRGDWWIPSNFVGSDTMPVRHRVDFKEALSTLHRFKNQEDQAYYQNWQSSSSSWWNWQESWWYSSSEISPRRWTQH